ncbi:MAG TPA: hypothetical protein EYH58_06730 [Aquifex aeolicus]|nr:hypothetical protein [Aquifex aeolicus]
MFKVGKVSYVNTIPLFHKLKSFPIIEGVPSKLVKLLRDGEIQAGIVSSVEYFFFPEKYLILPNISISSKGSVCSVKLFSHKPIEEIKNVNITSASLTSRYLLYYIFEEKFGFLPEEKKLSDAEAILLIGDEAMENERYPYVYPYVYDLGEEWYKFHKLPFVFALFLVRRDADKDFSKRLYKEIIESLNSFFKEAINNFKEYRFYFTNCIDYSLKEEHLRSLDIFFEYLSKKFRKGKPKLEFLK